MTELSRPEGAVPSGNMGNGLYCYVCGSTPAVFATFRRHQGLLAGMRFGKQAGQFCRDCGTATFRSMQGDSLWQGWWSPLSMLINPLVLLVNLGERTTVQALPAPVPGAPHPPLDPGKPLTRRPQIVGMVMPALMVSSALLTPLLAALLPAVSATERTAHPHATANAAESRNSRVTANGMDLEVATAAPYIQFVMPGDCLRDLRAPSETHLAPQLEKVSCDDPRAVARVLATTWAEIGEAFCAMHHPETEVVYSIEMTESPWSTLDELTLCTGGSP